MPKYRSQQSGYLSSVRNEPSTLTSRQTPPTHLETSYVTTNTGNVSFDSSYNSKLLTNQDDTSSAYNDDTETINGVEYIRAHLTLPNTNETISILMKKDENLGHILGLAQRRDKESGSEHSIRFENKKQKKHKVSNVSIERVFSFYLFRIHNNYVFNKKQVEVNQISKTTFQLLLKLIMYVETNNKCFFIISTCEISYQNRSSMENIKKNQESDGLR